MEKSGLSAWSTAGGRDRFRLRCRNTPEALEIIKTPGFVPEEMYDHIACIDQNPVRLTSTFSDIADHPSGFEPLKQMRGHRFQMSPGATRGNHHGIGHAGFSGEIDGNGVDRFIIKKRCFDEML